MERNEEKGFNRRVGDVNFLKTRPLAHTSLTPTPHPPTVSSPKIQVSETSSVGAFSGFNSQQQPASERDRGRKKETISMAGKINAVFYAKSYHPIQSGSIDGTDVLPHDNAVYRALLCSAAGLYDPFGDPKVIGDPYCTVFVGRLSRATDEESLKKIMSRYGRVKNLRLVRDIVTGASRGYAFVEYETEREMRCAYEDAHHSIIDDSEIIVDYNRQQLMPGWIPRRLGGGLGGKKESGQLRFGGRERPFRAPLRPIPYDELKRLGIPPPPEGRYISRFEIPSPPRRRSSSSHTERKYSPSRQRHDSPSRTKSKDREDTSKDREDAPPRRRSSSTERVDSSHKHHRDMEYSQKEDFSSGKLRSEDREEPYGRQRKIFTDRVDSCHKHHMVWENSQREDSLLGKRRSEDREEPHGRHMKSSTDTVDPSHKHHREREYSQREDSSSRKRSKVVEERSSSRDRDGSSHRYHRRYNDHSYGYQRSASEDHSS